MIAGKKSTDQLHNLAQESRSVGDRAGTGRRVGGGGRGARAGVGALHRRHRTKKGGARTSRDRGNATGWGAQPGTLHRSMETVIEYGVNHIDVAASYGEAELRLGPWRRGDATSLRRAYLRGGARRSTTLEKLQTDRIDAGGGGRGGGALGPGGGRGVRGRRNGGGGGGGGGGGSSHDAASSPTATC